MKPPIKGARRGPRNTVEENMAIATPRVRLSQISENTAATTAKGQLPKIPQKNRQTMRVCKSFATATAMLKTPNPNMATMIGRRRPLSSDRGAHIKGPEAYPMMYRELERMATSRPTLK
jgi:hypothetical protein